MRKVDRYERDEYEQAIFVSLNVILDDWFFNNHINYRYATNAEVSFMGRYLMCLGEKVAVIRENPAGEFGILIDVRYKDRPYYTGIILGYLYKFVSMHEIPSFLVKDIDKPASEHIKWYNLRISQIHSRNHKLSWVYQRNRYAEFYEEEIPYGKE